MQAGLAPEADNAALSQNVIARSPWNGRRGNLHLLARLSMEIAASALWASSQ
jgi:hypothetical protein